MCKPTIFILLTIAFSYSAHAQLSNQAQLLADLEGLFKNLSQRYTYFEEKNVDLDCLRSVYTQKIQEANSNDDVLLLFEYLLDEFYDNHISLSANLSSSYRLNGPLIVKPKGKTFTVVDFNNTYFGELIENIMGAELIAFNGIKMEQWIKQFPTFCNDKTNLAVQEWMANKILAGRYSEPRLVRLRLSSGKEYELDLDRLQENPRQHRLSSNIDKDNIGIIRFHNSLGQNQLITEFDTSLDQMMETRGLIIDLRNTISGGNTYVARGIMGRFITTEVPYQVHAYEEAYDDGPSITRKWLEYVSPRGRTYDRPVVLLVNRWTGSMGEGMAIGFEGMRRGTVMGSEMARLAGGISGFSFMHQTFGYQLSTEKLYHVNGIAREKYLPTILLKLEDNRGDQFLEQAKAFLLDK